jgi:hypothetical protein
MAAKSSQPLLRVCHQSVPSYLYLTGVRNLVRISQDKACSNPLIEGTANLSSFWGALLE